MDSVFIELALALTVALSCATILWIFKQPLILGYLLAGILSGPYVSSIVLSTHQFEFFSKLGITVLLFIVGLHLNPTVIKDLGKVSLYIGIGQIALTTIVGFIIALILGIDRVGAMYIAIGLTLSSTIIVLKLLTDKGDLHALYGKLAIGILVIQDVVATIILLFITSLSPAEGHSLTMMSLMLIGKGILLGGVLTVLSTKILPEVTSFLAASSELLFLFSLVWGFGIAALFTAIGFSMEIGALVAGVSLSPTPFANQIGSRLKPLRDFFIILFFILLGSEMILNDIPHLIIPALVLSAFVLIGNPVIVVIIMNLLGFKQKTGYLTGLTMTQVSEFSLIMATIGVTLGHISKETLSLITLVALITIAGSSYLLMYSERMYPFVEGILRWLEWKKESRQKKSPHEDTPDIILFGYGPAGKEFLQTFKKLDASFMVVDYNPDTIKELAHQGITCKFGDIDTVSFLDELPLETARLCVSTVSSTKTAELLTKTIRSTNRKAIIITLTSTTTHAQTLYESGASYVIVPQDLSVSHATRMIIRHGLNSGSYKEDRTRHRSYLKRRLQLVV